MKNPIHTTPLVLAALLPGDFARTLSFVPCGDWNGDGVPEIAVGLPRDDAHGTDAGRVLVLSGRDGSIVRELHADVAYSGFGFALATGTDVDRDGKFDLIVAAHRDGYPGHPGPPATVEYDRSGRIHVFSSATGEQLAEFEQPSEMRFGSAYASDVDVVADLDGDGVRDLCVTSRAECTEEATSPLVIVSARTGAWLRSYTFESRRPLLPLDFSGDGILDIVFARERGVFWTSASTNASEYTRIPTGDIVPAGEIAPTRIADVGDLDGDGRAELAILVELADERRCTDVVVLSAHDGLRLFEVHGEDVRREARVESSSWANRLDACGAPDVDGDGCGELLVVLAGAQRSSTIAEWERTYPGEPRPLGAQVIGYAALISSKTGATLWAALGSHRDPIGLCLFDYDFMDVQRIPDLDGDGLDDLAISSGGASTSYPFEETGAHLVVLSSKSGAHIATFDFRAGEAPRVRFAAQSAERPKGK